MEQTSLDLLQILRLKIADVEGRVCVINLSSDKYIQDCFAKQPYLILVLCEGTQPKIE